MFLYQAVIEFGAYEAHAGDDELVFGVVGGEAHHVREAVLDFLFPAAGQEGDDGSVVVRDFRALKVFKEI